MSTPQRLLGVFAHPDDESIAAGAFLAMAAHRGHDVSVVTCTRGELGEVVGANNQALAADAEALAAHRETELSEALAALGVARHMFLDQVPALGEQRPTRFRDSGMRWIRPGLAGPAEEAAPDALTNLDVETGAYLLAIVIRERQPTVVLGEDPGGGYGHPDHVQAHRMVMRGIELAADSQAAGEELAGLPAHRVAAVTWVAQEEPQMRQALALLEAHAAAAGALLDVEGEELTLQAADTSDLPAAVVDPAEIATSVEAGPALDAQLAALQAHGSQLRVAVGVAGPPPLAGYLATSNGVAQPILDTIAVRMAPGYEPAAVIALLEQDVGDGDGQGPGLAEEVAALEAPSSPSQPEGSTAAQHESPTRGRRITTHVVAAVLGLVMGALGTVVHRYDPGWPAGLLLGLLGIFAGVVTARAIARGGGLLLAAIGAVLMTQLMAFARPGGDVLVTDEAIGYAWLLGTPVACLLAAILPRRWFATLGQPAAQRSADAGEATENDSRSHDG